MRIVADLRENPVRARPKLGATFQDVSPPAALAAGRTQATGALIGGLVPGGLAEKAGIEAGDIASGHIFGTTTLGCDMYSHIIYWARPSMIVATVCALCVANCG